MSKYTYDELEKALGKGLSLEAKGDDKKEARVLCREADVGFISFQTGRIETSLCVRWHRAEAASVPRGFPGADDIAAAQQALEGKLLPIWEAKGFQAGGKGSPRAYHYEKEPDRSLTHLSTDVVCTADTLEDAVRQLHWMATAETEVWL
jgi:hypothetical protein